MKLAVAVGPTDHSTGPASAPVTLVQYGDYECSYCGQAYPIVKEIQRELGAKLRFVFRNFPLTQIHPHALHAAEVAEAVALHGKFWEIHDLLYENQRSLSDHALLQYAERLKLAPAEIATQAQSAPVIERIQHDLEGGERSGVQGTPAFYINGVRHDGSWELSSLLAAVKHALHGH